MWNWVRNPQPLVADRSSLQNEQEIVWPEDGDMHHAAASNGRTSTSVSARPVATGFAVFTIITPIAIIKYVLLLECISGSGGNIVVSLYCRGWRSRVVFPPCRWPSTSRTVCAGCTPRCDLVGGLRLTVSRFFMERLEATSDWPEDPMEAFRADFGDGP
ncbi:MAG: hypothetical protein LBL59_01280 [Xanthomonadaceae bacterium]|jgi:hypothetical protein|nr:hypothetical protein [Xanthomonadaceae bacterium]